MTTAQRPHSGGPAMEDVACKSLTSRKGADCLARWGLSGLRVGRFKYDGGDPGRDGGAALRALQRPRRGASDRGLREFKELDDRVAVRLDEPQPGQGAEARAHDRLVRQIIHLHFEITFVPIDTAFHAPGLPLRGLLGAGAQTALAFFSQ